MESKKISLLLFVALLQFGQRAEAVITHATDPSPLGKVCVLVGDGWTPGDPKVRLAILDNGPAGKVGLHTGTLPAGAKTESVKVVSEDSQVLSCELPGKGYRVAALQVWQGTEWSKSFIVNRARIDWLSTDQAAPGDRVRALGRSLVDLNLYGEEGRGEVPVSHGGYIPSGTRVVLRNASSIEFSCKVEMASAYDVHFRLPGDLPAGDYEVYLHNGLGGTAGWSEPQTLRIAARDAWPSKVFNIADYGAKGIFAELGGKNGRTHGMHDDSDAVEAALKAARDNGGGIVHFPAGSYMLTRTMALPKRTVLRGESRERSWIWFPDGIDHGTRKQGEACAVGFMGQSDFGIENLSIHGVYNTLLIAAPLQNANARTWKDIEHGTPGADNVFVRNCYVYQEPTYRYHHRKDDPLLSDERLGGPDSTWGMRAAIALRGDNVSVTDCQIKGGGMPVMLMGCRHATVARNRLYTGTAANGLGVYGGFYPQDPMPDKCIFEDNEIRPGTSRNHSGFWNHWTGSRYYFARNYFQLFWVCDVEGILFHGGGTQAILDVKEADGNQLLCEKTGPAKASWECVVVKGRGLGQSRMIVGVADNKLILDHPWDLEPDAGSRVAVLQCPTFKDHIIEDNRLEDTGAGIHCWGDGIGWMVDGNRLTRSGGIVFDTCSFDSRPWSGVYFMQVLRNVVDQGRFHGHIGDVWTTGYSGTGYYRTFLDGVLANVGHVFRHNLHKNDSGMAFWAREYFRDGQVPSKATTDVGLVVEENRFEDSQIGIDMRDGVRAVLKNNVFDNGDEHVRREARYYVGKAVAESFRKIDIDQSVVPVVRVNFSPEDAPGAEGILTDSGEAFEPRGGGVEFGWSKDNRVSFRKRDISEDPLVDTLAMFRKDVSWEYALGNGQYEVTVVLGDAQYGGDAYELDIEGVPACKDLVLAPGEFKLFTLRVDVADGRLSLTSGDNRTGPGQTRINCLNIRRIKEQ